MPGILRKWNLVLYAAQHQVALSLGTWDLCLSFHLCKVKRNNTWNLGTELAHTIEANFQPLECISQ